jgi:hypothetical protein
MENKYYQMFPDGTIQPLVLTNNTVPTVVADVISLLVREGELSLAQHILAFYTKE